MAASLTSRLLTELLPPDLAASLRQHLFNPRAPLQIYKRQLSWYLHRGLASIQPHPNGDGGPAGGASRGRDGDELDTQAGDVVDAAGVTGGVLGGSALYQYNLPNPVPTSSTR
ncbi:hypothetical protein E4U25_008183 [Claviceps purpurea]|nr:hypothetical protein E4U25_008183 [Claviceps purpurea]